MFVRCDTVLLSPGMPSHSSALELEAPLKPSFSIPMTPRHP